MFVIIKAMTDDSTIFSYSIFPNLIYSFWHESKLENYLVKNIPP